jgi:ubiquinone/menaquinone biosynthesis C-methylase UbiE
MVEKKIKLNDAYSLKTPEDSIKLYKKWAKTYDEEFALSSDYLSPQKISDFFIKHSKDTDTPILDVGAGTGLVGEFLSIKGKKEIIGIDISSEMLHQAKLKECYSSLIEADITKKIPLKENSLGAVVSAGTFTHGHVGPEAFDELLRITKPGGLFVLSINSKVFIKGGFQEKFLTIKNEISSPIFKKFNAHGNHKNKTYNEVKIIACIFRKKS